MKNYLITSWSTNDYEADKKISISLMAIFVVLTIQYFILFYFNLMGTPDAERVQLLSKILVGLAYAYALPIIFKRSKLKFVATYFIIFFLFLFHYWFFPENRIYIRTLLFPVFFMSLPAFIYSMSLYNWSILKKVMKKASYIVFFFGTILGVMTFLGRTNIGNYSMALSYYMLLPTIIFLDELTDKLSLNKLTLTSVSLLVILALGARGPILCVAVFLVLKMLRPNIKRTYKSVVGYTGMFFFAFLAYIYFEEILGELYDILLQFGIRSRSIALFLSGNIHMSGRERIYTNVLTKIFANPIKGIGLAGDRQILYGVNMYVHNIFIEILGNFGVILGSFIIISIILLIIKSLMIKDKLKYNLVSIWLSLGFVHLTISSSYLTDMNFWIFLGILINLNFIKNSKGAQNG